MEQTKKRKLGIRFRKQQAREWGWTVPSKDCCEIFDIETGEAIEGIFDVKFLSDNSNKVMIEARIFMAAVDSFERPEEHLEPIDLTVSPRLEDL